jgi:hypothetical protein
MSRVGLQAHFISDGAYVDPFEISSVSIFRKDSIFYPSSVFNTETQLIDTPTVSGSILMNFRNIDPATNSNDFLPGNYVEGDSGIYKINVGKYIVVLDGITQQTGTINLDGLNESIQNKVSSTGDYVDVWTVRMTEDSELQTIVNEFSLRKGGFTVLTQPLMLKAKSRLVNSKITLGSKIDLKVATDIHVENRDIDSSIKNLLRENVITEGSIEIVKINDSANLPAHVTVSSFSNTQPLTSITSDNVLIFTWDTSTLSTHPQLIAGNFGSIRGIYSIKTKFNIFNEVIISDPMYLTLS